MKIFFKSAFIKDFQKLPREIKTEIKQIFLDIMPKIDNLQDFRDYKIKLIRGFKNYYRIKIDNYRVGFKKENNSIIFMRVKHRRDIYKYFP